MTVLTDAQLAEWRALAAGPDGADLDAVIMCGRHGILAVLDEVIAARAEISDLRCSVIAFGAPWAVEYARDWGLPDKHLHAHHYDILARAGARMETFTRADEGAQA